MLLLPRIESLYIYIFNLHRTLKIKKFTGEKKFVRDIKKYYEFFFSLLTLRKFLTRGEYDRVS